MLVFMSVAFFDSSKKVSSHSASSERDSFTFFLPNSLIKFAPDALTILIIYEGAKVN